MLRDNRAGYGLVSILLHWTTGPIILFLIALGFYMRSLSYQSPLYYQLPKLHVSLGILVTLLMLLRALWRISSKTPERLPTVDKPSYFAAKLIKIALYLATFAVCVSGYIIATSDGQTINCFGLFSIPSTREYTAVGIDRAGFVHKYVALAIAGMVILHAGAALVHHFVKRDRTLVRMLKPTTKNETQNPS